LCECAPPHKPIDDLAAMRGVFGRDAARRTVRCWNAFSEARFRDAAELIRFHDLVLYLRAFPQSPRVLRLADEILFAIHERVAKVDEDRSTTPRSRASRARPFRPTSVFRCKSLILRHGRAISIDWENYEHADRLGAVFRNWSPNRARISRSRRIRMPDAGSQSCAVG
jgi:hypothetical protein